MNIRRAAALCLLLGSYAVAGIVSAVAKEASQQTVTAHEAWSRANDAAKKARDATLQEVQAADNAAYAAAQAEPLRVTEAVLDAADRPMCP
jgi:copper(I)-binding protein